MSRFPKAIDADDSHDVTDSMMTALLEKCSSLSSFCEDFTAKNLSQMIRNIVNVDVCEDTRKIKLTKSHNKPVFQDVSWMTYLLLYIKSAIKINVE